MATYVLTYKAPGKTPRIVAVASDASNPAEALKTFFPERPVRLRYHSSSDGSPYGLYEASCDGNIIPEGFPAFTVMKHLSFVGPVKVLKKYVILETT